MIRQFLVAFGAPLGLSGSVLWGGDARQMQLRWGELAPRIENRKVALVLPGGTHIEGKVEGVEPEGLRLRVAGTSDHKELPKGSQPLGAVAGGIGGAIGGYHAGKALDRRVTEIRIVREDRAGSER